MFIDGVCRFDLVEQGVMKILYRFGQASQILFGQATDRCQGCITPRPLRSERPETHESSLDHGKILDSSADSLQHLIEMVSGTPDFWMVGVIHRNIHDKPFLGTAHAAPSSI
jgi:hypothetical protein